MTRRALIVGEAPSRLSPERLPSSRRLVAELGGGGLPWVNLLPSPMDAHGKGSAFDVVRARDSAKMLVRTLDAVGSRATLILLGQRVLSAFNGGYRADFFEEVRIAGRRAYVVPHPSGIVRNWNDPEVRERARELFARFAR